MKKNFKENGNKMICIQEHDITLVLAKDDYQRRICKYMLSLIAFKTRIFTQNLLPLNSYKKRQQLLRTLQKNYPFKFGYTIRYSNDEFSSDLGFKYALHNYNQQP